MSDYRSASGRYLDWGAISHDARKHPGKWVVVLRNQPVRLARNVRERSHPQLRLLDGRLEARVLHSYVGETGHRRGDIHIRFVPRQGNDSLPTGEPTTAPTT